MRTSDERIAALHERATEIRKESRSHRVRVIQAVSAVACVAFVVALAALMPGLDTQQVEGTPGSLHGSIFTDTANLGYIVIGIVAFLLGSTLTMFMFRLKKWQEIRNREDEALF